MKATVQVDSGPVLAFKTWGELVKHINKVGAANMDLPKPASVGGTDLVILPTGKVTNLAVRTETKPQPEPPGEFEEI